jgi:hypothetical protein
VVVPIPSLIWSSRKYSMKGRNYETHYLRKYPRSFVRSEYSLQRLFSKSSICFFTWGDITRYAQVHLAEISEQRKFLFRLHSARLGKFMEMYIEIGHNRFVSSPCQFTQCSQ